MLTVQKSGDGYSLAFPYDPALVEAVKALPQRKWNPTHKTWWVPKHSAADLKQLIARLPGSQLDPAIAAEIDDLVNSHIASIEASKLKSADLEIPVPEGCEFMPFQRAGIAYALARPNTLIGDQMGLGKTPQTVGVSNADVTMWRVLIICPASLKLNWSREWKKWDTKRLSVGIVAPNSATLPATQVVIINYDLLKRFIGQIHAREWDMLCCDEAHYMKCGNTQRALLVLGGKQKGGGKIEPIKARRKLFLTGTPISNRPKELWTLVHALAPDVFSSWWNFAYRYCGAVKTQYGLEADGASNLDELQDKLRATCMVRRLKADVLTELPAKRRQVIEIPCESRAVANERSAWERQRAQVEALKLAVELAKGGTDAEYADAVTALQKGTTAAFTEMAILRHETALAKVPLIISHVEDALEAGKVILFAYHQDVIAKLAAAFPGCVVVTGQTKIEDRQVAVDRFQKDPACKLFIGNLIAAGVGLTLTASSHVVFCEIDWVPGNISQAEDRAHRIGQRDNVLVQHLVLEGSLDATMAKRLVAKQTVIDAALDKSHESNDEPLLPLMPQEEPATENTSRKQIAHESEALTQIQIQAVHLGLQMLAGICDGAHSLDGAGFNKFDTAIGKSLAERHSLSPKQGALGMKLVRKYRRQLPETVLTQAGVQ